MVNQEIIELKQGLHTNWVILKDEGKTNTVRKNAYEGIMKMQDKIVTLEKELKVPEKDRFDPIDLSTTRFADVLKGDVKKPNKIIWPSSKLPWHQESKLRYNGYVSLAVEITKERHPGIDTDGNLFGQIVNATTQNLIALNSS